jgi:hypothetical protein
MTSPSLRYQSHLRVGGGCCSLLELFLLRGVVAVAHVLVLLVEPVRIGVAGESHVHLVHVWFTLLDKQMVFTVSLKAC